MKKKETLKEKAFRLWKKAGLPKFLNKFGPKKTPAWEIYLCHLEYPVHAPAWRRASSFMEDYHSTTRHWTTWQKAIQKWPVSVWDALSKARVDREEMLPNLQLMTVDRPTMAHGLEARVPFLDVDLIRTSMNLEISDLISEDLGKIPLRKIAQNFLPDEVAYGEKKIYFVPIDHWMEQGLDYFVQERIFSSKILSGIPVSYTHLTLPTKRIV